MSDKIDQQVFDRVSCNSQSSYTLSKELTDGYIQLICTLARIEEIEQILNRQPEWSRVKKVRFESLCSFGKCL